MSNKEETKNLLRSIVMTFAICHTGYGKSGFNDSFQRNVHDAHDAGLICGAYHYSYALNPADTIIEAHLCKCIIAEAGLLLELPVFFDMEDADGYKARHGFHFTRRNITDICASFIDAIKPLNCGVYASLSWRNRDDLRGFIWKFTDRLKIGNAFFDGNILYD